MTGHFVLSGRRWKKILPYTFPGSHKHLTQKTLVQVRYLGEILNRPLPYHEKAGTGHLPRRPRPTKSELSQDQSRRKVRV